MCGDSLKVLHVVPDIAATTGGQSAAAIGLCEELSGLGLEVCLLTTDYEISNRRQFSAINLQAVPCNFSPWRWSLTFRRALLKLLVGVQLVHLHGLWLYPIWCAAQECRDKGVPYIVRPCGMLEKWSLSQKRAKKRVYSWLFENKTIQAAAAIHFTSHNERRNSEAVGSDSPAFVLPLGLSRQSFEVLPPRGTFKRRFPELAEKKIVLFLGRLHPKKRPEALIEAFSRVVPELPDSALVFVGPGEDHYVAHLRAKSESLTARGSVFFTGMLQGDAVQEALVDAHLFVLPSSQENFGMAVAEAMAACCPVIVSPQVAIAGEIESYSAGMVVPGEIQPLSEAIRFLLVREESRRLMGQQGRKLVLERFSRDRLAPWLVEVYQDIVSGKRQSSAWTQNASD